MFDFLESYLSADKKKNFYFFVSLFLSFFMPLYKISSSPFIILISIIIIFEIIGSKAQILNTFRRHNSYALFLLFFLFAAFSLFYSDNFSMGLDQVVKRLPLLIFPLWFSIWRPHKIQVFAILKAFIFGLLMAFVVSLLSQGVNYIQGLEVSFYYIKFVEILWMHPTYLSLYLNLGIVITYFLYQEKEFNKIGAFMICSIFVVFILLLFARMQIIVMFIVLIILTLHYLKNRFSFRFLALSILLCAIATTFICQNESLRNRFNYIQNFEYEFSNENQKAWNGLNVRLAIWHTAWDAIAENPIIGAGIGNDNSVLLDSYLNHDFKFAYKLKYTAHNQFIQTLLATGLIGLILYLLILFNFTLEAFKRRQFSLLLFTLLILLTGFTESYLRMQAGVIFFAFFGCLFVHKNLRI